MILEDPVVFTTPPVNFPASVILQARWITHHFYTFIYLVFKPAHYTFTCCKVVYVLFLFVIVIPMKECQGSTQSYCLL